uniref:Cohesin subunit SCC3/SA HEAT-repeats domain-containing protein n=1 Tax=Denticeps clupeoides TaxID=299321 RepID=A0AAY4E9A6_9TELE
MQEYGEWPVAGGALLCVSSGVWNRQGPGVSTIILLCLYLCQYHEHGDYLVDSFWDAAGTELRDWETTVSLLLSEEWGPEEGENLPQIQYKGTNKTDIKFISDIFFS